MEFAECQRVLCRKLDGEIVRSGTIGRARDSAFFEIAADDCLGAENSMKPVATDEKSKMLFVGWPSLHHKEWTDG